MLWCKASEEQQKLLEELLVERAVCDLIGGALMFDQRGQQLREISGRPRLAVVVKHGGSADGTRRVAIVMRQTAHGARQLP